MDLMTRDFYLTLSAIALVVFLSYIATRWLGDRLLTSEKPETAGG